MTDEILTRRLKNIPILTMTLDGQDATAGMETFRITVFRKSASCTLKIPAFLNPYPISSSDRYTSVCVITLFISFLYPVFPSALKGRASA